MELEEELRAMRGADLDTVEREALADIRAARIDGTLPPGERFRRYLEQVQNPYCFRCGAVAVKLVFSEEADAPELEDALAGLLLRLRDGRA